MYEIQCLSLISHFGQKVAAEYGGKEYIYFFIKIDSPKFVCLIKHKVCFHLRVFMVNWEA